MRALVPAAAVALLLVSRPAPAAAGEFDVTAIGASAAMQEYFDGEKRGGWVLVAMGAAGLGAGGALLTRDAAIERAVGYPLLGVGLVHVAAGIFVYITSSARTGRFESQIARSSLGWSRREYDRMQGVKTQFTVLKIVEVALIAGGAAMVAIGRHTERSRLAGVGIGVIIEAAATLAFDIVAARRAAIYSRRLGNLRMVALDPVGTEVAPALAWRVDF